MMSQSPEKDFGDTSVKIDFLTIVGEREDAIQLNNMLNSVQADLLFLDIEMPDMSDWTFWRALRTLLR